GVRSGLGGDIRSRGRSSQRPGPMRRGCYDAGALLAVFEKLYFEPFGYIAEGEPVELVNLRLSAIGKAASRLHFDRLALDPRALAGESGERVGSFSRGAPRVAAGLVPRGPFGGEMIPRPAGTGNDSTTNVGPPPRSVP